MSLVRYLGGLGYLAALMVPLVAGAYALRARLLPQWTGAPARLAEVVLTLALLVAVLEVVGALGLLSKLPLVLTCLAAGAGALLVGRRSPDCGGEEPPAGPEPGRLALLSAVLAVALVAGGWVARTVEALDGGMTNADTLWYHLPVAARFVQEGSITGLHYLDSGPVTVFYPATSGLLHATGMLAFGNDLLSPLLNMLWLAVALLAAWCVGRPFGVAPVALAGLALLLVTPGLVTTQPGGAYNDIAGLALFLAAVALLLNGGLRSPVLALAGMAAGLAFGLKYTFIAPGLLLTAGVVATAPHGSRRRVALAWLIPFSAAGCFWYLRNLFSVGNPLPNLSLDLGPLSLPSPSVATPSSTVAQYLGDGPVWRDIFLPGLEQAFGPGWWALLGLAIAGALLNIVGARGLRRVLGFVSAVALAAFVLTPQFLGTPGFPFFFSVNLRYAAPALALGLVLLPTAPMVQKGRRRGLVLALIGLALLATQLDPAVWPTELRSGRFVEPPRGLPVTVGVIAAVLSAAAGLAAVLGPRGRISARRGAIAIAIAAAVVVSGGFALQHRYLADRYAASTPLPATFAWAQGLENSRIATVGNFLQYPLYGRDLSNHVQYLGQRRRYGGFGRIRDCATWRRAINAGDYRFVVTAPEGFPQAGGTAPEALWTSSDPAARPVLEEVAEPGKARVVVFRLAGQLTPGGCRALGTRARLAPGSDAVLRGGG